MSWRKSAGFGRPNPTTSDALLASICQDSTAPGTQRLRALYRQMLAIERQDDPPIHLRSPPRSYQSSDEDTLATYFIEPETTFDQWEHDIMSTFAKGKERVYEILNRCQYLYSKRGLDLQSLIRELKAEQAVVRANYQADRDRSYEISKRKAEAHYFGSSTAALLGSEQQIRDETLQLPPIDQSNQKRTKMEKLLGDREARDKALVDAEQLELAQDWTDKLDIMSSLISEEMDEFVPPRAAQTFSELLGSHFNHTNQ